LCYAFMVLIGPGANCVKIGGNQIAFLERKNIQFTERRDVLREDSASSFDRSNGLFRSCTGSRVHELIADSVPSGRDNSCTSPLRLQIRLIEDREHPVAKVGFKLSVKVLLTID
jgi:hypothetical protein